MEAASIEGSLYARRRVIMLERSIVQTSRVVAGMFTTWKRGRENTLVIMTLKIDDANQALAEEITFIVQLLKINLLHIKYALFALGNIISTVSFDNDALHFDHVLLNNVQIIF